jgi:hypothetical protein
MRILIVEDDAIDAIWLRNMIAEAFPGVQTDVLSTESEFISNFARIVKDPPVLALVDVILRWADPAPDIPEPPGEVLAHGPYRGGFRIVDALASRPETRWVPVILTSSGSIGQMDERIRLPENVVRLPKQELSYRLIGIARSLLAASPAGHEMLKSTAQSRPATEKKRIFVSYSHRDHKWLEELQVTLRPMLRNGEFLLWSDKQIEAGDSWRSEIENALKSASIAILLVSRYFFASDFIAKNELPPLLDTAAKNGLRILWIALSASDYHHSPIATYQALNDPTRPLDSLKPAGRNKELVRIGGTIHDLATR